MVDKVQILAMMVAEFNRWENLLAGFPEEQITARAASSAWSTKDVVAHLMVWQQRTIARLEAALNQQEPVFPLWPEGIAPDEEEPVDVVNAWLYAGQRDRSWESIYSDWKNGFMRLIDLVTVIPEADMLQDGKYPWLNGDPLSAVLTGTCEHHQEHYEEYQGGSQPG